MSDLSDDAGSSVDIGHEHIIDEVFEGVDFVRSINELNHIKHLPGALDEDVELRVQQAAEAAGVVLRAAHQMHITRENKYKAALVCLLIEAVVRPNQTHVVV